MQWWNNGWIEGEIMLLLEEEINSQRYDDQDEYEEDVVLVQHW